MARMKDGIYCFPCNVEMKLGTIPKYDYLEGFFLHDVPAYICPKCHNTFFTEEQAHDMKAKTEKLLKTAKVIQQ